MAQVPFDYTPAFKPEPPVLAPKVTGATTAGQQQPAAPTPAGSQTTVAQTAAAPASKPPVNPNAYDYSGDPILMQAKAYAASANQQAQAQAAAKIKQLGIEYNDPNNPFSTLARLDRQYGETLTNTNEAYNKQNLWYGGHRAKALGDLATALQQSKYDAANQYRAQATDVGNNLANALLGNQQSLISAESDAYNRALQQALQYGIDPGAPVVPDVPAEPPAAAASPTAGMTIAGALGAGQGSSQQRAVGSGAGVGAGVGQAPVPGSGGGMTVTGSAGAGSGASGKPKLAEAPRYYTYKKDVPLRQGQTVHYKAGLGYYAA